MDLAELLSRIYPQSDSDYTKDLLEKYKLSSVLQFTIDKICKKPDDQKPLTENQITTQISSISSSLLTSVNAKLSGITVSEDKKQLELIVSDLAFELMKTVLGNYTGDVTFLLTTIQESLKIACQLNGYDFSALQQSFPLQKFIEIQPKKQNIDRTIVYAIKPAYYKWNSSEFNLHDLCHTLKSKNIIKNTKDFHKLFAYPEGNLTVSFNRDFHDELIVMFDLLHSKGHISPIGNKGHFVPFKLYAVDFENKPLVNSEVKTIKYTLKKNTKKWQELNTKAEKWFLNFKS